MRSQKTQNKSQNKLLFCKLCPFVAESYEELDHHIKMSHSYDDDIEEEFTPIFVDKKTYEKMLYNDYLRICKGGGCIIRPQIDFEDDKNEVRRLYKEYCETCELKKLLLSELKQNGKM
ncbi:hypothetical protein CCL42_gp35 [Sulfolobus islandicus rod-shaped virus 8]|uniref:Uncharacterized protein n=2 Tax=Usarudivirus TaxID=2843109 RepID=A0A1X9SJG6_9VIRU|nr:hypothetical protein CCL41_gp33 [Sulfolobus islandicus rod-shaped virus 9]YP_009362708.1 hypothetical protein CCL42_gp35 [Sulfolobus islandicus rod-shaped virus 8]ARQ96381.1 hypothetical protein [Sulfolobus islandicus rod-shaped virus 9]ARQ96441.1 hypothetical protein [Sulfolobus islandicus rod-shaped virus 8]